MIGSCTLTVKDGGSYRVHILGGIILGDHTVDEMVKIDEKYKKKPDVVLTDEKDVFRILSSHQCNSANEPDYSEFAGDRHWFVDLPTKSFIDTEEFVKNRRQRFAAELEAERFVHEQMIKAKTRKLMREARRDAKIFCKELLAFIEGKSEQPFKTESWAKENRDYDSQEFRIGNFSVSRRRKNSEVQFFAPGYSKDYDLIRGKFDFKQIFFNYLRKEGWRITLFNSYEGNRTWVNSWFAQKGKSTMFWNRHIESNIRLVKVETI